MSDKYNDFNTENKDNEDIKKNDESGEYRYSSVPQNSKYYYSQDQYKEIPNNVNDKATKKPNKVKKSLGFVFKAVAFGLIAAVTFMGVNMIVNNIYPDINNNKEHLTDNIENNEFQIEQTEVLYNSVEETDVTTVVENAMPSIVSIKGTFTETYNFFGQQIDEERPGAGSGIIIDKNDTELLIATNNHVVEGAKPIEVIFIDGESSEAIIKGTDSTADLAVIAVDITTLSEGTKDAIKVSSVLDDEDIKVGEKVVAIGNALGIGQSVTVGYVSAVDREVNIDNNKMTLLQTDAAINPGNSGGALINMDGEVIGINTVKFASNTVEGMGYAIPITRAMPILNELKSREIIAEEDQGYLGIAIQDVTEDIAEMFNWPVGVYVSEAIEGGAAKNAGILNGDIITGINDIEITSTTQLIEKVTSYHAGTEVAIKLMRKQGDEYKEMNIEVTLGRK